MTTGTLAGEPAVDDSELRDGSNVSSDPLFGPRGPSPDDVRQGEDGDCYFLATLYDFARADPGLIEQDVSQSGDGTYRVRFEDDGCDVYETVDGEMPADAEGNFLYAALGDGGATWVAVMEKAFTYFRHPDLRPSYAGIALGWSEEVFSALGATDITGLDAHLFPDGSGLSGEIASEAAAGRMMTFLSRPVPARCWGITCTRCSASTTTGRSSSATRGVPTPIRRTTAGTWPSTRNRP